MSAKLFTSEEEVEQFEIQYYKEYCDKYKSLKNDMMFYEYRESYLSNALEFYLGNVHRQANAYMRDPEDVTKELTNQYDVMIDRVHEIILSAPLLPEDIWVFRGIDENEFNIIKRSMKENGVYYCLSFLSTSMRLETVKKEIPSQYYLKLLVKKGTPALCINQIKNRGEEEILFPSKMVITGMHKKMMQGTLVYECTLTSTQFIIKN